MAYFAVMITTAVVGILLAYVEACRQEEKIRKREAERERMEREKRASFSAFHASAQKILQSDAIEQSDVIMNRGLYKPMVELDKKNPKVEYINYPSSSASVTVTSSTYVSAVTSFSISDYIKAQMEEKELKPRTCPNCGAPVRGRVCDYCGTHFE